MDAIKIGLKHDRAKQGLTLTHFDWLQFNGIIKIFEDSMYSHRISFCRYKIRTNSNQMQSFIELITIAQKFPFQLAHSLADTKLLFFCIIPRFKFQFQFQFLFVFFSVCWIFIFEYFFINFLNWTFHLTHFKRHFILHFTLNDGKKVFRPPTSSIPTSQSITFAHIIIALCFRPINQLCCCFWVVLYF